MSYPSRIVWLVLAATVLFAGGCMAVGRDIDTGAPMIGVPVGQGDGQAIAEGIGGAATTIGGLVGGPVGAGIAAAGTGLAGIIAALWQRSQGRHKGWEEATGTPPAAKPDGGAA